VLNDLITFIQLFSFQRENFSSIGEKRFFVFSPLKNYRKEAKLKSSKGIGFCKNKKKHRELSKRRVIFRILSLKICQIEKAIPSSFVFRKKFNKKWIPQHTKNSPSLLMENWDLCAFLATTTKNSYDIGKLIQQESVEIPIKLISTQLILLSEISSHRRFFFKLKVTFEEFRISKYKMKPKKNW